MPFSDSAKDLGFIFDSKLSMKKHVIKICDTAYFEFKRISSIRFLFVLFLLKTQPRLLLPKCTVIIIIIVLLLLSVAHGTRPSSRRGLFFLSFYLPPQSGGGCDWLTVSGVSHGRFESSLPLQQWPTRR